MSDTPATPLDEIEEAMRLEANRMRAKAHALIDAQFDAVDQRRRLEFEAVRRLHQHGPN